MMIPFPKSILEFQDWFPAEEACQKYLFQSRYPDGFICPVCGGREYYWIRTRKLLQCKKGFHQTSLTAGTVMHGSKLPLRLWFWVAYLMATETPGMSAVQLQRQFGLKRYEPVFHVLHKLRSSMVRYNRDKIDSIVELDETYVGGPTRGGKRGRGTEKALVIVAVEKKGRKAGRVRLRHIPDFRESTIKKFATDSIIKGSTIITDGLKTYGNLNKCGYSHRPVIQKGIGEHAPLSLVHIIMSNLKTWLKGTFHGVSKKHLQAYLNEFVFRFNRRKTPMAAFQTLLGLSSNVEDWPTYEGIYRGTWTHPNPKDAVYE